MAENYNILMEKEISTLSGRPELLLHSCCGPCSSWVLGVLHEHFDLSLLYYNPNIYPNTEYDIRLKSQKELINGMFRQGEITLIPTEYNYREFLSVSGGLESEPEGGARCDRCFALRLEETAKQAKERGFDFFTTTLTVSPHKNAQIINATGLKLGEKYGVKYLVSDFKKRDGYRNSIELSKKYELYRQNYCGCEFSLLNM